MINLRSFDLQMIIIYHIISLLVFFLGLFLFYNGNKPKIISSIFFSLGWFLLRVLPFFILLIIAIESELNTKADSLIGYLGNINVYRNAILILLFLSSLGIFAQIISYTFNFNNMQDPLAIPEFMK